MTTQLIFFCEYFALRVLYKRLGKHGNGLLVSTLNRSHSNQVITENDSQKKKRGSKRYITK